MRYLIFLFLCFLPGCALLREVQETKGDKPAFDPSKPFEVVDVAPPKPASFEVLSEQWCTKHSDFFKTKKECVDVWAKADTEGKESTLTALKLGLPTDLVLCLSQKMTNYPTPDICRYAITHPIEYRCATETRSIKTAAYYQCVNYLEARQFREEETQKSNEQKQAIEKLQQDQKKLERDQVLTSTHSSSSSFDSGLGIYDRYRLDELERQQRIQNCVNSNRGARINMPCR